MQFTPDGHLLYSARHQDWLIKIDYANGSGSGQVIWRLGKDGDFGVRSDDPLPWFSHQHDANYELGETSTGCSFSTTEIRDGSRTGTIHSRGQVYEVDEANRLVTLV